jgi:hypothetical protein
MLYFISLMKHTEHKLIFSVVFNVLMRLKNNKYTKKQELLPTLVVTLHVNPLYGLLVSRYRRASWRWPSG